MTGSRWGTDSEMWPTIPPPFTPATQDVELVLRACPEELLGESAAPRILVLGVTPALIGAPWPARNELHAVDYDPFMIESLWRERAGAHCHCANWQAMPFPDDTFDLVVGDCSFNALPDVDEYENVLKEIARISRPSSVLVSRFFMRPKQPLSLFTLLSEVTGSFSGFSSAAMRLMIPIAASEWDGSLNSRDIPTKITEQCCDVDTFLAALGQEGQDKDRALRTFALEMRLNYPNRRQIEEIFGRHYGRVVIDFPDYDCGQFCPVVSCTQPRNA